MKREPEHATEPEPDLFELDGLARLLERAERSPTASAELDFLADLVSAAELERARLARPAPLPRGRPFLVNPWLLATAASLLFLLALSAWLLRGERSPARERLATLAPPLYVASELRAPGDELAAEFARAMEPYARRDWPAAATALEAFLAREPGHGPARFYLGATYEQLGEPARAEGEYERAGASPDALLAEHARLRLAQSWLARGEEERARAALRALVDGGGELAPNARALLDGLAAR